MTYDHYASEAAPDIGTYAFNGRNLNEGYIEMHPTHKTQHRTEPQTHTTRCKQQQHVTSATHLQCLDVQRCRSLHIER